MTDYFALLDQPREPWLDQEKLREAFHEKSRLAHPDAGGDEAAFAEINQAYQILQDPKRRLQHLLTLHGQSPSAAGEAIAADIADLFRDAAGASHAAERVMQELVAATSPLRRSLLQSDLQQARERLSEVLETLLRLYANADDELKALTEARAMTAAKGVGELQRLYARFAYLTRWMRELEEKRAQLSAW